MGETIPLAERKIAWLLMPIATIVRMWSHTPFSRPAPAAKNPPDRGRNRRSTRLNGSRYGMNREAA